MSIANLEITNIILSFRWYPAAAGSKTLHCTLSVLLGMPVTGKDELPPQLKCETVPTHGSGVVELSLLGDTRTFFEGIDILYGDVSISGPVDIVRNNDEIFFDEETSKQISITYGGETRRALESSRELEGVRRCAVLVIRVSSDSNALTSVADSESQLSNNIFGANNNNLVSLPPFLV